MAIRQPSAEPDGRLPERLQRTGPARPDQDLRRARIGAAHVRHTEHRRERLETEHDVQGRLPFQSHSGAVVLEGGAILPERDAGQTVAVRDGNVEGADERV